MIDLGAVFRSRYLIRFDDISPYMDWCVWNEIELLLDLYNIKPILAIVPDCKDESIMVGSFNPNFWEKVREWELKGWGIALHGYQHRFVTQDSGIVGINNYSEFSGLSFKDQEYKIQRGLSIFKENNCKKPSIWIAPAHSFDSETIKVLSKYGIDCISDSFALYPFKNKAVLWIPQQLWRFRTLPFGVWTVCLHHNTWNICDIDLFEKKVKLFQRDIIDMNFIIENYKTRRLGIFDRLFSKIFVKVILLKRRIRSFL